MLLKLIIAWFVVAGFFYCSNDDQLKSEFLGLAPASWSEFNKRFDRSICGKSVCHTETPRIFEQVSEYKANGESFSVCTNGLPPDLNSLSVFCINSEYGFRLTGNPKNGWVLVNAVAASEADFLSTLKFDDASPIRTGISPASIFVASLESLVVDPSFKLLRIEKVADGMVTVEFELLGQRTKKELEQIQSGKLVVNPNNYWLPLEVSAKFTSGLTIERTFEFSKDSELPRTSYTSTTWRGGGTASEMKYDWSFSGADLDDREFTLSHYGLPEPIWNAEQSSFLKWFQDNVVLIVIALMLVCGVVGSKFFLTR